MTACLLLATLQALAQLPDYHVKLFDESFGIRTGDVRKVVRDHKGFVWIMHNDRVQRFDGKRITNFMLEESLQSLLCDANNTIWVASGTKLFSYANDQQEFILRQIDTSLVRIVSLLEFPGEDVWVMTTKGCYVLDPQSNFFQKHEDPVLRDGPFQWRGADANLNTVFFCNPDSLISYNIHTHTRRAMLLPEDNVYRVTALTEDQVFVCNWKWNLYLYDFSKGTVKEINMGDHLKQAQHYFIVVFGAEEITDGKFLLATSKGLLEYDILHEKFRQLSLFHKGKPLEGNILFKDIFLDRGGAAWAAYNNYGLLSLDISTNQIGLIRNFETDVDRAWDNHVRDFAEDENGNIWLGTFNGFARLNQTTGLITPYFATEGASDRINHPSIRGIVYDGTNLILGQTNSGVWIFNPETESYQRPVYIPGAQGLMTKRKLEGSFTEEIYTLVNGDHIIAGSNAAYLIKKNTYLISEIDFPGAKENINFTFQDDQHNIWISTESTLYCLDAQFQYKSRLPTRQMAGTINGLCQSTDQTLIAGGRGLYRIKLVDTTAFVEKVDSYFDSMDIRILYPAGQKLWLGTSEGLLRYDMRTGEVETFSHFENIEGNAFYPNSFCRAGNGLLFMGSSRGIIYLDPEKIQKEKDSLEVFISRLMINEKDTSLLSGNKPLRLKYDQHTVSLEIETAYFNNANKLKYRYRLEGLNTDWVYAGNNTSVRFHALRPGAYSFSAAASINGIEWFDIKESLAFIISPPFWVTWWFYLMVGIMIASLVYLVYRYQLNKKLEVERLRLGIARDLHDDIGSALSNIHIVSSMAFEKQPHNGHDRLSFEKIKLSSREILENMQDIVWAINPRNDSLGQALSKMKEFAGEMCESTEMDYAFEVAEGLESIRLSVIKRKDLFLVFKEAVNNAIKYSGGSMIHISLQRSPGGWLTLTVKDNGHGFEWDEVRHGNGLRNMKERAEEVNGQIRINTGQGQGTAVELRIPFT